MIYNRYVIMRLFSLTFTDTTCEVGATGVVYPHTCNYQIITVTDLPPLVVWKVLSFSFNLFVLDSQADHDVPARTQCSPSFH